MTVVSIEPFVALRVLQFCGSLVQILSRVQISPTPNIHFSLLPIEKKKGFFAYAAGLYWDVLLKPGDVIKLSEIVVFNQTQFT